MASKLLIIGRCPPPIGGVSIHVERLLESLLLSHFEFTHLAITKRNMVCLPAAILGHKVIHLHASSPWLRLFVTLLGIILRRRTIMTVHGSLKRWNWVRNAADYLAVTFARVPIVLNRDSMALASRLNRRSRLMSAFIPPVGLEELPQSVTDAVGALTSKHEQVLCTNAFNVTFDKNGCEIYGISDLMRVFTALPTKGLVVSDPTGSYARYLACEGIEIPSNVRFLCEAHSFYSILKVCDAMIRATTTDGDAISVREALHLGVPVLASDCINRPDGCCVFESGNWEQLAKMISSVGQCGNNDANSFRDPEVVGQLMVLYRELGC